MSHSEPGFLLNKGAYENMFPTLSIYSNMGHDLIGILPMTDFEVSSVQVCWHTSLMVYVLMYGEPFLHTPLPIAYRTVHVGLILSDIYMD